MSGVAALQKDRNYIAVIGDEVYLLLISHVFIIGLISLFVVQDSVTGLLLAGIGHVNQQQKRNFLVVDTSMY